MIPAVSTTSMNYGEDLPCALVVARQKELQQNQNVLYNLVKPTKDKPELIESNLKLANVLPKNRIYRMESIEEFELFSSELLKRPLILQCTVDGGPGMACMSCFPNLDCRMVRFKENYIVLFNQAHPKILARLQMGLEVAQRAMRRSQSFILTFSFNEVIERLYSAILREFSETLGSQDIVNCHDGEIIIRYAHDSQGSNFQDALKVKEMTFTFDDLGELDLRVDSMRCAQARQRRSLPLDQGELVSVLKGWKFGDLDTTRDLLNAYAEISGEASPPPYQSAVLLPVAGTKPAQSPPNYYGYNSRHSPVHTSYHYDMDTHDRPMTSHSRRVIKPPQDLQYDLDTDRTEYVNDGYNRDQDSPERRYQYAGQNLSLDRDSDGYPYAVITDDTKVEYHDRHASREQKRHFATHQFQIGHEELHASRQAPVPMVQGKSGHQEIYNIQAAGQKGFQLHMRGKEEEDDDDDEVHGESFI